MGRILKRILAAFALLIVAGLAGFATLRLAIHGREVSVPNLAGMSDAQAAETASHLGLHLSVENRFYASAVPPNHVLSQSPAPGSQVRRGLQVRVTESLGTQRVAVPDTTGQNEHSAEMVLKRSQLEPGRVAYLPAPGPAGTVLAQTPPPNSTGLDGPRVSLLVADGEPAAASIAYVMPSLLGLTLSGASLRLSSVGLHIASSSEPDLTPVAPAAETVPGVDASSAAGSTAAAPAPAASTPAGAGATAGVTPAAPDPAIPPTVAVPLTPSFDAIVIGQSPAPGHRVSRADSIRLTLVHHGEPALP